jgi:hypothetical protein
MDDSERLAGEYLRSCGFVDPIYEPDGKVPPDFLIDGGIAVEVRRLNQMHKSGRETPGLEQIQRSLAWKVPVLLKSLGPSPAGDSWLVSLSFRRPLLPWWQIRKCLGNELRVFSQDASSRIESHYTIRIEENLAIRLDRAGSVHDDFFVFGGYTDLNAGGWVISEIERNMTICIREKTNAISRFWHKYGEWWLVLIDRIAYANIESEDAGALRNRLDGLADWDRVVLVSPTNPTRGLRI